MRVAKTKALFNCAVTAPLFSHRQKVDFLMMRTDVRYHTDKQFWNGYSIRSRSHHKRKHPARISEHLMFLHPDIHWLTIKTEN